MASPRRGEVWLVDLGMTAKVRPALVISVPANDADRALVTLVPHTTSLRQSQFEGPPRMLPPGRPSASTTSTCFDTHEGVTLEFMGIVSHDLLNLSNAMVGISALIEKEVAQENGATRANVATAIPDRQIFRFNDQLPSSGT